MLPSPPALTAFEREILEVFWDLGRAPVRQIQEALPARKRPAYTTVQTIVTRLEGKGAVRRAGKIGNALLFEATLTRPRLERHLISKLLEQLGGSAKPLVAYLLENGDLTLADLRALESHTSEPSSPTIGGDE